MSTRLGLRRGVSLSVLATAISASSCAVPDQTGELGDVPDARSFIDNGVSAFMERRCGSLDCHGQPGRPLRIYSEWGLRLATGEGGSRDKRPTTPEEQLANYQSVVGLEPENLASCFESRGEECDTFQLLLKPLGIENDGIRHKGGPVLVGGRGDPGWVCLSGWVRGAADRASCEEAAKVP